jgi:hypothetical protein
MDARPSPPRDLERDSESGVSSSPER